MKKIIIIAMLSIAPLLANAATCPPPNQVFTKSGNEYIPSPPAGWKLSNWSSHLESDDVVFVLAAYGADLHPPTDKDNHVRCYYGNPVLTDKVGMGIETQDVVAETQIEPHPEWSYRNEHYYMCRPNDNGDVSSCPFN